MSDIDLAKLNRDAIASGTVNDRINLLRARMRAGELSKLTCNQCKGTGKGERRISSHEKRPRIIGQVCCCGSEERDSEHGYGGIDNYTHSFTHACEYYETDCQCNTEEIMEDVPIWTTNCKRCNGSKFEPLYSGIELAAYLGDEAAQDICISYSKNNDLYECWGVYYDYREARKMAVPPSGIGASPKSDSWFKGLERWGFDVVIRSWLAAASALLRKGEICNCRGIVDSYDGCVISHEILYPGCLVLKTIESIIDWLNCPCNEHLKRWAEAQVDVIASGGTSASNFIVNPGDALHVSAQRVERVKMRLGEQQTIDAICHVMIPWALAENEF